MKLGTVRTFRFGDYLLIGFSKSWLDEFNTLSFEISFLKDRLCLMSQERRMKKNE